jgi:hypothetical protein
MNLLTGFSALGSVLTLVGIYGVLSLCGLATQRVGYPKRDGRATNGHSQIDLRRRIPVDHRWRDCRRRFGHRFVASAEVVPV